MDAADYERRGTIIRLVRTLRGGDRPKDAHDEYSEVSVIPKALYEPWLLFRKPLDGRIRDNLEKWGTGGLQRPERDRPFEDVIPSARAPDRERAVVANRSLPGRPGGNQARGPYGAAVVTLTGSASKTNSMWPKLEESF
jgi:site-specific DNA-methyltransferase (adenine-specific)